jgi:hypothetical protein
VIACNQDTEKSPDRRKSEKEKKSQKFQEETVTTCLFLSKDLLYLIPFYDLQRIKDLNRADRKIVQLRKKCHREYKDMIRRWKRSFK